MLKTYVGTRTAAGPTVWVSCAPTSESGSIGYPLRWRTTAGDGWGSAQLARALLVDLCGAATYHQRTDLHRALASEVLAELDQDRWVLTQAALVDWLVGAHAASIWRRRAAGEAAPTEPWPWELSPTVAPAAGALQGGAVDTPGATGAGVRGRSTNARRRAR